MYRRKAIAVPRDMKTNEGSKVERGKPEEVERVVDMEVEGGDRQNLVAND